MLEPQCKQAVQLPHGHHAMRKPKLDPVKRIQKEALSLSEESKLMSSQPQLIQFSRITATTWESHARGTQPIPCQIADTQKLWEMINYLPLFQATKSWEDLYLSWESQALQVNLQFLFILPQTLQCPLTLHPSKWSLEDFSSRTFLDHHLWFNQFTAFFKTFFITLTSYKCTLHPLISYCKSGHEAHLLLICGTSACGYSIKM